MVSLAIIVVMSFCVAIFAQCPVRVSAVDPTPTPTPTPTPLEFTYYTIYLGQPDTYWKYTWLQKETLNSSYISGHYTSGGIADKYMQVIYSDSDCTAPYTPTRNATVSIQIQNPCFDWRNENKYELMECDNVAKAMGINYSTWNYYINQSPDTWGAPWTLGESWTYTWRHEDLTIGINDIARSAVVADATQEVTVPAGTFTCYVVTHTQDTKTLVEYWDAGGVFPYAPIKTVDNRSFDDIQTSELYSTVLPTPTPPSEVWVDDDYNASSCGGHWWEHDAFDKIQDGIDNVSTPGTVHVAAGTYYENIVLKDGIELLGAGNASTIIDGMQNGSVIKANDIGNTTRLDGFTVTNGSGTSVMFSATNHACGGGMYNNNASLTIIDCTFQNNLATGFVGGNDNDDYGGGMANLFGSSPTITDCTFRSNSISGTGYGGGMANLFGSSPTVTDCIFQGNSAFSSGGGMYTEGTSPTITNCIFQNNSTHCWGGGMDNTYSSLPTITNCIFQGNSAFYGGGGIENYNSCSSTITNCVLWDNRPDDICNFASTPVVTYCDVKGTLYPGIGNINASPMFANAAAGDFHLTAGSPCIDAGDNSASSLPSADFDGDRRILPVWGTVDMGVDEYVPPVPWCDSWDVRYKIVGGQVTLNYSLGGLGGIKKTTTLSEAQGGDMIIKFCKTVNNGTRTVVIPQNSWHMDSVYVPDITPGVDMDLSINLSADAVGVLYVQTGVGDVDISSVSSRTTTPKQINTFGDGIKDVAGSMLLDAPLRGYGATSIGPVINLPLGLVFTTGNTTNVVSIPSSKFNGATLTSNGTAFTKSGVLEIADYVGTAGTITTTGTGDCLGLTLVSFPIDFQYEIKLEIEPIYEVALLGFYGDADQNGKLNLMDYSSVQLMRFGQRPFNPDADANRDGLLSILDYSSVQLMRFGQYPKISKYEVRYDFTSGNGSNKWAKNSSITAPPPTLNKTFATDTGWTNATATHYNNISSTDGIVWNISGTSGKYAALQCRFTIFGTPADITSIGVRLNGFSEMNGDVLQLWAWNFSSGSWRQIGSNSSMTTSIATYGVWTTWGKVYTNYIDGNGYMYILANLNNVGENLYVDDIKLTTVQS